MCLKAITSICLHKYCNYTVHAFAGYYRIFRSRHSLALIHGLTPCCRDLLGFVFASLPSSGRSLPQPSSFPASLIVSFSGNIRTSRMTRTRMTSPPYYKSSTRRLYQSAPMYQSVKMNTPPKTARRPLIPNPPAMPVIKASRTQGFLCTS